MHHPRISELQKNFGGTLKQGSPKNQNCTAGLHAICTVLGSDRRSELAPKLIASDRRSSSDRWLRMM